MHLQIQNPMDSFGQGLEIPPSTAGHQSHFHGPRYNDHHLEMPQENLSFNSNGWHIPQIDPFDADPTWAYNVPASTPQLGWEDMKHWPESPPTKQVHWIGHHSDMNGKAANKGFSEVHDAPIPDTVDSRMDDGTRVTEEYNQHDEHVWNEDHGAIDYEQLAESFK